MTAPLETTGIARRFDVLTLVLFAAVLLAPAIDHLVRDDAARGPGPELRTPAPRPAFPTTTADLAKFPAAYEAYWKDSFGLRDQLLRWHSALKVFVFGVSPDTTHVIGKERWIFNDNHRIVDNWRGVIPFTDEELARWKQRIERRRDAVAALGAHYFFSIAPDKPGIYPDFMPDRIDKIGPARIDQLFAYLAKNSTADVLDIRPALIADRANDRPGDRVYFELGTHWQKRGAIVGYNAIAEHLQRRLPKLRTWPVAMHVHEASPGGDSEGANMYIGDLLPQTKHWWALPDRKARVVQHDDAKRRWIFEKDDPSLPRIVIFHDSFGETFFDEWAETSSRLVLVHDYDFDLELIRAEKPDLVIEFIVERMLVAHAPELLTEHERLAPPK